MAIFADGYFFRVVLKAETRLSVRRLILLFFLSNETNEGINLKYKQNFLAKTTKLVSACSAKTIYRRRVLINFFFFWLLLLADVFLLF